MKIVTLLSETSAANERSKRELSKIHETLVAQIYKLKQLSVDNLKDIERASRPVGDDGLAEINMIIV